MPVAVAQWSKVIFPNEMQTDFIWKSKSKWRAIHVAC